MNGQKKTANLIASVPAELTLNPLELCWQQYLTFGKKLSSKKASNLEPKTSERRCSCWSWSTERNSQQWSKKCDQGGKRKKYWDYLVLEIADVRLKIRKGFTEVILAPKKTKKQKAEKWVGGIHKDMSFIRKVNSLNATFCSWSQRAIGSQNLGAVVGESRFFWLFLSQFFPCASTKGQSQRQHTSHMDALVQAGMTILSFLKQQKPHNFPG